MAVKARRVEARIVEAGPGEARLGVAWRGKTRQSRMGLAWLGRAIEMMDEASRIRLDALRLMEKCKAGQPTDADVADRLKDGIENHDPSLDDLQLSVRTYNCLRRAGINRLSNLQGYDEHKLMKIRNLGPKSIAEIKNVMEQYGMSI